MVHKFSGGTLSPHPQPSPGPNPDMLHLHLIKLRELSLRPALPPRQHLRHLIAILPFPTIPHAAISLTAPQKEKRIRIFFESKARRALLVDCLPASQVPAQAALFKRKCIVG